MFNRLWIVFPMLLTWVIGFYRYDVMLTSQGFEPLGDDIKDTVKLRLGLCFMLFFQLVLLAMVTSTQVLKYTIRRERPQKKPEAPRLSNLRDHEIGTYSMPSGDTSAAAVFCLLLAFIMKMPQCYAVLPLVAMGRVFYQCHWFGDTIVGSIVGTLWGLIGCSQFLMMAPLMQVIAGEGTFTPQ